MQTRRTPLVLASLGLSLLSACGGGDAGRSEPADQGAPDATAVSTEAATSSPTPATGPVAFNPDSLLFGTAKPTLGQGAPGKVSVIYMPTFKADQNGSGTLPIVFRNNTSDGISHVDISAKVRNATGALVATGTSQGTDPAQLAPGEAGLAFIYFDFDAAPQIKAGAKYEFSFESTKVDSSSYNTASVAVTEAARVGGKIVGAGVNKTEAALQGPYSVSVYCFDAKGALTSHNGSFANEDANIKPGATVSFSADLYGKACSTFLVGVSGYYA